MTFRFDHPEMLWLALLALPVIILGWRSLVTVDPFRRTVAIALRLFVLAIMILLLAGFETVRMHTGLSVIAVIDHSQSIQRLAKIDTDKQALLAEPINPSVKRWIEATGKDRHVDDRLGVIRYDGKPTVISLPSADINFQRGANTLPIEGTNASAALRLAMAQLPADTSSRLLLVSDGNDSNPDELIAAAREAKAASLPIDVLPIDYQLTTEVLLDGLYAPRQASEGQTVPLRVVLRATKPAPGQLHLLHDDIPVDLSNNQATTSLQIEPEDWSTPNPLPSDSGTSQNAYTQTSPYVCVKVIEVPSLLIGVNRFKAIFQPLATFDLVKANNFAQAFTLVRGRGKVLLVTDTTTPDENPLIAALHKHDIDLEAIHAFALDNSLANLQRYDAVVLHNVPADEITVSKQQTIEQFVHELGGGLLMIGGANGFGAGGWAGGPIDNALPVSCEVPSRTVLLSGALVLVLDRSGSMKQRVGDTRYTQQEIANEAALLALQTLFTEDYVGVIAFDNEPTWVQPLGKNSDALTTAKKVSQINPGGGTDIYPALVEAYKALAKLQPRDAAVKHVILLSDGESKPGNFKAIARKMAEAGITLSTIGIGDEHDADLLSMLAVRTDGTFHPVIDPLDLPQVFIKEARTVRQSLIRDKQFTPTLLNTGSPITAGLSALPQLNGMVLTIAKPDPRAILVMTGIDDAPLFAHWQYGLGQSAAFTSEAAGSWADDWLKWPGYNDFWSRTIRAIARPTVSKNHDLLASIKGDTLNLRLETSSSTINLAQILGSVLSPTGQTLRVKLKQVGPGVYQTQLPAPDTGNYIITLIAKDTAGQTQTIFGGATKLPGQELRNFQSNRTLLEQVANLTGGRVLSLDQSGKDILFDRAGIQTSRSIQPLTKPLLIWLIILLLVDIACRRIAWDAAALRRRLLNFLGITDQSTARATSSAITLANLRSKVGDFDRPEPESQATLAPPNTPAGMPSNADWRTYEQPEQSESHTTEQEQSAIEDDRDPAATTSRLLAAKKRAQNKNDENG